MPERPLPVVAAPVRPGATTAEMLYEVIAMPFVPTAGRETPIGTREQTVLVILLTNGTGNTVMTMALMTAEQPLEFNSVTSSVQVPTPVHDTVIRSLGAAPLLIVPAPPVPAIIFQVYVEPGVWTTPYGIVEFKHTDISPEFGNPGNCPITPNEPAANTSTSIHCRSLNCVFII